MTSAGTSTPEGLLVVDKPSGLSSHDVVARVRRLAGTRKVGHAGTLDPMATGVLVVGVGRATRLLGHLALTDKAYDARMHLGVVTSTDDAHGDVMATADQAALDAVGPDALSRALAEQTGAISQVPSSVSALKIDGRRAYAIARAGEEVVLAARPVTVSRFEARSFTRTPTGIEVEVVVECSTGTYVRALARDVGARLGVGGHLSALRRTRVGPYDLLQARTLEQLAEHLEVMPLARAAALAFPRRDLDAEDARRMGHGVAPPVAGMGPGPIAVFGPEGSLLALVEERDGRVRPQVVFQPSTPTPPGSRAQTAVPSHLLP